MKVKVGKRIATIENWTLCATSKLKNNNVALDMITMEIAENPEKADKLNDMKIGDFDPYLVTAGIPDPDLIVRTSGESRISNYLLWQSAYSELLFVDVLWPDFRKPEFYSALESYAKRERRYGKVK